GCLKAPATGASDEWLSLDRTRLTGPLVFPSLSVYRGFFTSGPHARKCALRSGCTKKRTAVLISGLFVFRDKPVEKADAETGGGFGICRLVGFVPRDAGDIQMRPDAAIVDEMREEPGGRARSAVAPHGAGVAKI